jgi:hypothetical protein
MNKRIRELHIQAQQEAWNEPIDIENCAVEDIKGFSQQVYEKFAELMVLDTIKNCRDMFMVNSVSWNLLNEKLEHFGVEE